MSCESAQAMLRCPTLLGIKGEMLEAGNRGHGIENVSVQSGYARCVGTSDDGSAAGLSNVGSVAG